MGLGSVERAFLSAPVNFGSLYVLCHEAAAETRRRLEALAGMYGKIF